MSLDPPETTPDGSDSAESQGLAERVHDVSRAVSNLITRANNIERHAGKQEALYYRLHSQLKVVEDSVQSLNAWRRRMEVEQAALSPLIRFGTSTWAYEGWQGMVYQHAYEKRRFKQDCLAEYVRYLYRGHPLFRTVGLDLSFYGPPSVELLAHYATQLPDGFEMCSKVWEAITIPRFVDHPRYGEKAGQPNPRFLDAKVFVEEVLPPYERVFQGHIGPFIFEFQRTGLIPSTFLPRLERFLSQLPPRYRYAIEVRNPLILAAVQGRSRGARGRAPGPLARGWSACGRWPPWNRSCSAASRRRRRAGTRTPTTCSARWRGSSSRWWSSSARCSRSRRSAASRPAR